MRHLRLREHQATSGFELEPGEVDFLSDTAKVLVTPTVGRPGFYDLRPGSTIGMVELGDLTVEIRPKLPIERVLFLMSYALDPESFSQGMPEMSVARTLHEALVPAFVHQVKRSIRQGVLQGYRTREESLGTVRGRLRLSDQVSGRFGIAPPLEVTFDDFTEDIDENRVLKAAMRKLGRLPLRSAAARRSLSLLEVPFSAVPLVDYTSHELPEFHWTRLNQRYRSAVALSKLILQGTAFEAQVGEVTARGFLVDMNRVFEDFVVVALREVLGLDARRFPQGDGRLRLDEAQRVKLKPDVSWWRAGSCLFVGDVKYKKVEVAGILHPDLYQLLAYTVAADLSSGLLVYAAGEADAVIHDVTPAGKKLCVQTLDLEGDIDEVLSQMEALASVVRQMAEPYARRRIVPRSQVTS